MRRRFGPEEKEWNEVVMLGRYGRMDGVEAVVATVPLQFAATRVSRSHINTIMAFTSSRSIPHPTLRIHFVGGEPQWQTKDQ